MRLRGVIGLAMVVAGLWLALKGVQYGRKRNVLEVGDFKASITERQEVPRWPGWILAAGGALLVLTAIGGGGRRD